MTPPDGATLVMHGRLLLGYKYDPHPRQRLTPLQGRAAVRLRHLDALGRLRARYGILLVDPSGWLAVVVDCLAELAGVGSWRLTAGAVFRFLPELDRPAITPDLIAAAMDARRRSGRLISDHEAGTLIGLVDEERRELEAEGVVVTMHPVDETEQARAERRERRQRTMAAVRQKERRKRLKDGSAKGVTRSAILQETVTAHSSLMGRDSSLQYSPPDHEIVAAAIAGGCSAPGEIAAVSGLKLTTVRPILTRLKHAGRIVSTSRGCYVLAPDTPATAMAGAMPAASRKLAQIGVQTRSLAARLRAAVLPAIHNLEAHNGTPQNS